MEIVFTFEDIIAFTALAIILIYTITVILKMEYREWKIKKKKGND